MSYERIDDKKAGDITVVNDEEYKLFNDTGGCDGCHFNFDKDQKCCNHPVNGSGMGIGCSISRLIFVKQEPKQTLEFKVGDKVKVVRKVEQEDGWGDDWVFNMTDSINLTGEVINVSKTQGVRVQFDDDYYWNFPPSSLELVQEEEQSSESFTEYNVVSKPKHYMLFPEKNIEVRHLMKVLADRLSSNLYSSMFISDYIQMQQYLLRFDEKNGLEDLKKAQWYLGKLIEEIETESKGE